MGFPKYPGTCQEYRYSTKPDGKTPLPKTCMLIMEKSSRCLTEPSLLCPSIFLIGQYSVQPKEKHKHQLGYKTFDLQWYPACKLYYCSGEQTLCGNNIVLRLSHKMEPITDYCIVAKNLKLDCPETLGKPKPIGLLKYSNKMI